jgi:hypothetical protein
MRKIRYVKVVQRMRREKKKVKNVANVTPFCAHVGKPNNMKTIDAAQNFYTTKAYFSCRIITINGPTSSNTKMHVSPH